MMIIVSIVTTITNMMTIIIFIVTNTILTSLALVDSWCCDSSRPPPTENPYQHHGPAPLSSSSPRTWLSSFSSWLSCPPTVLKPYHDLTVGGQEQKIITSSRGLVAPSPTLWDNKHQYVFSFWYLMPIPNPSFAQSETFRTPQKVPAWTVSWPHTQSRTPGLAGHWSALTWWWWWRRWRRQMCSGAACLLPK